VKNFATACRIWAPDLYLSVGPRTVTPVVDRQASPSASPSPPARSIATTATAVIAASLFVPAPRAFTGGARELLAAGPEGPSPQPSPTGQVLPGRLGRFLTDPGAALSAWAHHLADEALHAGADVLPVVATVGSIVLAGLLTVVLLRTFTRARGRRGARWVEIYLPATVDPAGGEAFWRAAAVVSRPGWRRLLTGRPVLGFELVWSTAGLRLGVWVPGEVNPMLVARAVEAAWPGARCVAGVAGPPLPPTARAVGGQLGLSAPEWLPLSVEDRADPLRGLLGQALDLHAGQLAVLQVLARPASRRRVVRARAALRGVRTGRPVSVVARLLDVVEGLISAGPSPRPAPRSPLALDPLRQAALRGGAGKLADVPLWQVAVRYAVGSEQRGRGARRAARATAAGLRMGFGAYTGANSLRSRRLARPVTALGGRAFRHGFLAGTAELAALAHLPSDPTVPGLSRAGARPVPPPAAVAGGFAGWPPYPDDADAERRQPHQRGGDQARPADRADPSSAEPAWPEVPDA
jgi:hypothetical protein